MCRIALVCEDLCEYIIVQADLFTVTVCNLSIMPGRKPHKDPCIGACQGHFLTHPTVVFFGNVSEPSHTPELIAFCLQMAPSLVKYEIAVHIPTHVF